MRKTIAGLEQFADAQFARGMREGAVAKAKELSVEREKMRTDAMLAKALRSTTYCAMRSLAIIEKYHGW